MKKGWAGNVSFGMNSYRKNVKTGEVIG